MRLFVALAVPDEVSAALETVAAAWRARVEGRWTRPDDRHLTLKFLGEVAPERLDEATAALEGAARGRGAIPLGLAPLGTFPPTGRAKVLWAGVRDPDGALGPLAGGIDAAFEGIVAPDTRPFAAHLTLARFDPPRRLPEELRAAPVPPVGWTVREVLLQRSHLGGGPPRYETLARAGLGLHDGASDG